MTIDDKPSLASPQTPGERPEYAMLDGLDLAEVQAHDVLARAHGEFNASDKAASLFDWQAEALRNAGLLAPVRAALASGDAAPTPGYLVASIRAKAADEAIGMCCEGTGECGIDDCRSDSARLIGLVDAADYVAALAARSPRPETAPDDAPAAPVDEMEGHFLDANERMGEALVSIGMALGLPRPRVGATWGAREILARIEEIPAAARSPREEPRTHVGVEASGVMWMAMRYALGRATYAVGEVLDAIQRHVHELPPGDRQVMASEIEQVIREGRAGTGMDRERWWRAVDTLRAPAETTEETTRD